MELFEQIDEQLRQLGNLSSECKLQIVASQLMKRYPGTPAAIAAMAVCYVQHAQKEAFARSISKLPEMLVTYVQG